VHAAETVVGLRQHRTRLEQEAERRSRQHRPRQMPPHQQNQQESEEQEEQAGDPVLQTDDFVISREDPHRAPLARPSVDLAGPPQRPARHRARVLAVTHDLRAVHEHMPHADRELMRALDLYGYARLAVAEQTDATRAALEAYADGVNAWLRVVQRDALGRGAPEFFLFSPDIAPWTPADSIAVQKLMALSMTDKAGMETLRARLSLPRHAESAPSGGDYRSNAYESPI